MDLDHVLRRGKSGLCRFGREAFDQSRRNPLFHRSAFIADRHNAAVSVIAMPAKDEGFLGLQPMDGAFLGQACQRPVDRCRRKLRGILLEFSEQIISRLWLVMLAQHRQHLLLHFSDRSGHDVGTFVR